MEIIKYLNLTNWTIQLLKQKMIQVTRQESAYLYYFRSGV